MSKQLFPGYDTALDTESLIPKIQESLTKDYKHLEISDCKISEVKFYPTRYGTVLYKLKMHDHFFQNRWEHYLTAQLLPEGKEPSYACPPFLRKEKENLAFFLFPNDPAIDWLPQVCHQKTMIEQFRKYWLPKNLKARKMEIDLLSYTPQMRAAFEYRLLLEDRNTNETEWVSWIGKTNLFKASYRIHARHYSVWKASQGKISMPQPMGFIKNPQVAFQEKVPGERLGNVIHSPDIREILQNIAKSIAHFHQMRVPLANQRTHQTEIGTLNRWCNVLKNVSEELRPRIETLESKISVEIERRVKLRAPIHADFHQANVLVNGKEIYLVDYDEMAFGDPAVDLGRFLASLRSPMMRAKKLDTFWEERERFLETYARHSEINMRSVCLFEAASLLTSAASAFRLQRPTWEEEVPILIEESEKLFRKSKEMKSTFIKKISDLSFEERLAWMEDKEFLIALLSPHIEGDLTEFHVVRKKVQNSSLWITFKVSYWVGEEKKRKNIVIQLPKWKDARKIYESNKKEKEIVYLPEIKAILSED